MRMLKYETVYKVLQLITFFEFSEGISWKKSDIIVDLQPVESVLWWFVVPNQSGRGSIACCIYCETADACMSFTYNQNTRNCTLFDRTFIAVQGNELTSTGNNYYTDSLITTTTTTTTTTSTATTSTSTPGATTTTTTVLVTTTTAVSGEDDDD